MGSHFLPYYRRYEEIFKEDCKGLDKRKKKNVRHLLCKPTLSETKKYCNFIPPKKPLEICFEESIKILIDDNSMKRARYSTYVQHMLGMSKLKKKNYENGDFVTYDGIVNKVCEKFKLGELFPDVFKCLMFVKGLTANEDTET